MSTTLLIADRPDAGTTLLRFIAERLSISNNKAKALLDRRNVFVNRKRTWMAKHVLKSGDKVEIAEVRNSSPRDRGPEVLYEDAYYLIVNKKPGMLSNGEDSVEDAVAQQQNAAGIRAAHRLDRDTSGCLLLARDGQAFDAAVSVFRKRDVHKTYHAIVQGCVPDKILTITTPLGGKRP